MKPLKIGSVVLSKAGRDHSNYFLVLEIVNSTTVKVVDGKLRRLDNPKIKNIKHLVNTGIVIEGLAEKITAGKIIYDAQVYSALHKINPQNGGLNV